MKHIIRKLLKEESEIKSNYQKIIDNFKDVLPKEYHNSVDDVFKQIREYIEKEGFTIKVLNSCSVPFAGVRTKKYIVICSPTNYKSLADLVYVLFHEIRHEIQMSKLKQIDPMSGDIDDFEELYKIYWEMEMDAHNYGLEWVNKIKDIIKLPNIYYELSGGITEYPTLGHMVKYQIESLNNMVKELKNKGDYEDISDLPMIKNFLNKLEDLF